LLPKRNRLGRKETALLFKRGERARHALAWARFLPADGEVKLAFSVSGGLRGAIARNRVKRLFREAARDLLPSLSNGWLVVVIKPEAEGQCMERVRQCLALFCEKVGMKGVG
jgi:ribonuclease P protein component